MSKYSTKLLGFGDNVVDIYDHQKTMYPGGNCVNVSVYGKMSGCEKTAYMGYFGDDEEAELVIDALKKNGVETVKCRQLHGENGYSRSKRSKTYGVFPLIPPSLKSRNSLSPSFNVIREYPFSP